MSKTQGLALNTQHPPNRATYKKEIAVRSPMLLGIDPCRLLKDKSLSDQTRHELTSKKEKERQKKKDNIQICELRSTRNIHFKSSSQEIRRKDSFGNRVRNQPVNFQIGGNN